MFWRATRTLYPDEIEERASQFCALAYNDGQVVAASTGHLFDFPRLRSRFVYYRTIVDASVRRQRLASRLCVFSRDRLAEWVREHPEEKAQGLFIVIQADEFKHRQHVPVARQLSLDLVLVGYSPSGHQMRVVWFPDANVE